MGPSILIRAGDSLIKIFYNTVVAINHSIHNLSLVREMKLMEI